MTKKEKPAEKETADAGGLAEKETAQSKEAEKPKLHHRIHHKLKKHHLKVSTLLLVAFGILFAGVWYLQILNSRVYIENAEINAPIISLGPQALVCLCPAPNQISLTIICPDKYLFGPFCQNSQSVLTYLLSVRKGIVLTG
jgi:hypothetical protein